MKDKLDNELNSLPDDLKYAFENGILDLSHIQQLVEMKRRKELLEQHPYQIWQGKNGRWYCYLVIDGKRVQKERSSKKAIEDLIVKYQRSLQENPTIEEVFTECNDHRYYDLKKISSATYMRNKQCYRRHFGTFGKRHIRNVTAADFVEFLEMQVPEYNLTSRGFSNLKSIVKIFLRRARKRGLISWDIRDVFDDLDVSDIDFRKEIREDNQEVFDEEETRKIKEYLLENLDLKNCGLLLAFDTGLRPGELSTLKPEDLGDDGTVKIRRTETKYENEAGVKKFRVKDYPKTRAGVRTVVLPRQSVWLIGRLKELSQESKEYLFEREDGSRMDNQAFYRRLELICKKIGIYRKSPNKIRKTYDSILLDNGADKKLVQEQMGHEDIQVSERNYHRNRKSIDRKREILSSIKEFDWIPVKSNQIEIEKT